MNSFYPERVRLRQERNKPHPGKKKAVGINLSPQVVDYFKGLADPFTLSPPKGPSLPEVDRSYAEEFEAITAAPCSLLCDPPAAKNEIP